MRPISLLSLGLVVISLAAGACSSHPQGNAVSPPLPSAGAMSASQAQSNPPRLITMNSRTNRLEAWPIQRGGGSDPEPFTPPLNVGGANVLSTIGDVVVMVESFPSSRVVLYNTKSGTTRFLDDPFGVPIAIAVATDKTIYALNVSKSGSPITMYQPPAHHAVELNCSVMPTGQAIAVDNEGDIFIQGYSNSQFSIAEIPNGPGGPAPQNCAILQLETNPGYVGGIAVDPKTDSLITLDDPSLCAGGEEGRMTVYPKPYDQSTGRSKDIGKNCTGGLWLNADSTIVFTSDQDVSGSFSFILQRSFPDGGDMGIYHGSNFAGLAPMPSALPN